MVQVFPMPLAVFWTPLRVASLSLSLPAASELSRSAGGEIVVAELGVRLWRVRVTLAKAAYADAAAEQAKLRLLQRAGASVFVSPRIGDTPHKDPNGVIAVSTVTVASLPAGNQTLSLTGLPSGYTLSPGDYLSFSHGTPTIHAFHQIMEATQAAANGTTPAFEVLPQVRPGVAVGAVVTLVKPVFRAVLTPKSMQEGVMQSAWVSGTQFELIQTLKG